MEEGKGDTNNIKSERTYTVYIVDELARRVPA